MAAPVDSARQVTNISTAADPWAVNVGSPVAGTLLIVYIRLAGGGTVTTFTGYTPLVNGATDPNTDDRTYVYYRWADGAEGASDSLDLSGTEKGAAICWEVTGAANPASDGPPNVSTQVNGTTTANSANGGSVAPVAAPQDTLYLVMSGGGGEVGAYTAFPTNYANLIAANSGTGGAAASNVICGGASRAINASSSEDPGAFTHGAHTGGWSAYTVAIHPPLPPRSLAPEALNQRRTPRRRTLQRL